MTPKEIQEAQQLNKQTVFDKIKVICDEHGVSLMPKTRLLFEDGQWKDYSSVVIIDALEELNKPEVEEGQT